MDWLDLLAVQGTLKSLLQHHSSKASVLPCSAFFIVQLSHPYMTTGKTVALTRQSFVGKIMSLLFNMLSSLVIAFLPSSKHLLISWLRLKCKIRKYKAFRGNHGQCTLDINHSKILFDPPPRLMEIKTKINKWDLIKLLHSKENNSLN